MGMTCTRFCERCRRPCVKPFCWRCAKNTRRNPVGAFRPNGMIDGVAVQVNRNGVILANKLTSIKDDAAERARRVEIYRTWVERHNGHLDMQAALAEADAAERAMRRAA